MGTRLKISFNVILIISLLSSLFQPFVLANSSSPQQSYPLNKALPGPLSSENILVASDAANEISPVTSCDKHNACLTVWQAGGDIHYRLIESYGKLRDEVVLDESSGVQSNPSLTYNADQDEFFVVYKSQPADTHLMGARISITGSVISGPFTITTTSLGRAEVTYVNSADPYLVLYERTASGNKDIELLQLDADGAYITASTITADSSVSESFPRMASDGSGVFAVWEEGSLSTGESSIYGCWIDAANPIGCAAPKHAFTSPSTNDAVPDVAYNSVAARFLLIWHEAGHIYAQSADRQMQLGEKIIVGAVDTGNAKPLLKFSPSDGVFLAVWGSAAQPNLRGQYLSGNGQPIAGETFSMPNAVISDRASLDFNSALNHFILSWPEWTGFSSDIYAQLIGSLENHDNAIFASRKQEQDADVVYNPATDQYFAVAVETETLTPTLSAGFINGGDIFTGTQAITLSLAADIAYTQPALAFVPGGATDYYVLAATAAISGDKDIWAWWIDKQGTVITSTMLISGTGDQTNPDLAYHTGEQKLIVAWEDNNSQRVYRKVFTPMGAPDGNPALVSNPLKEAHHPYITPGANGYLVVWEQSDGEDRDIATRQFLLDGSPAGSIYPLKINSFTPQTEPAAAYSPSRGQYIVAWEDSRYAGSVYEIPVEAGGTPPPDANPTRLFSQFDQCGAPAISYRAAQNKFYIAASCRDNGSKSVYLQRLDEQGQPWESEFIIPYDYSLGDQYQPVLAQSSAQRTIFLWRDERHGAANPDVYGRLLALLPNLSSSHTEAASSSAIPGVITPGTTATVTVSISNVLGLNDALDVEAISYLPEHTSYISGTVQGGASFTSTNQIRWNGVVSDAEEAVYQFSVSLSPSIPDDSQLVFTTVISAVSVAPFIISDTLKIASGGDLSHSQLSVSADSANAGEVLTYTLLARNSGTDKVFDATATLLIPTGAAYVPNSANPATSPPSNGQIHFDLGDIAVGQVVTAAYQVSLDVPAPPLSVITNQLVLSAAGLIAPISKTVSTAVSSQVDLSVSLIQPAIFNVEPRQFITYTVILTNQGTLTATNATFEGAIPKHTTFITHTVDGSTSIISGTNIVSHSNGTLLAGGSDSFTFSVRVDNVLTNSYAIVAGGVFSAENALSPYTTTALPVLVNSSPQIIANLNAPDEHQACGQIWVNILADNTLGNENATGTVVSVTLPTSYHIDSTSHPYDVLSDTLIFDLALLPGGISETVRIGVSLPDFIADGTQLTAYAWVGSDQTEVISDIVTTTIRSLCIQKSNNPNPVEPLEELSYHIEVTSRDMSTLTNIQVEDHLSRDVTYQSGGDDFPNGVVTWIPFDLNPGESRSFDINTLVKLNTNGSVISNRATAEAFNAEQVSAWANARIAAPDLSSSIMEVSPTETPIDNIVEEEIEYRVFVNNTGALAATGAIVTMTIPSDTSFELDSTFPSATDHILDTNLIRWIGDVPAGGSVEVGFIAKVMPTLEDGDLLTSATTVYDDQALEMVQLEATATYRGEPNFSFIKTVTPEGPIGVGERLDYTITLINQGDADATNLRVYDDVPTGARFLSASGGVSPNGNNRLIWDLGTIPAVGQEHEKVVTFAVQAESDWIVNQAFAFYAQSGAISSTVASNSLLTIEASALDNPVEAGELLTWSLTIANLSPDPIINVVVADRLLAHTSFEQVLDDGNFDANSGQFSWTIDEIPGDNSQEVRFVVRVDSPLANNTVLQNHDYNVDCAACLTPIPGSPVEITVHSQPNMYIQKEAAPDPLPVGEVIRYTLTISNSGNDQAASVLITDTLPAGLTDIDCNNGALVDHTCRWSNLTIPAGQSLQVWAEAAAALTLNDGDTLINEAYGADLPAQTGGPVSTVIVAPVLQLESGINPSPVTPGGDVTFILTVTNTGSWTATDLSIIDDYPPEIINGDQSLPWTLAGLGPGQSYVVSEPVTIASPLSDGQVLTNTFIAEAANLPSPLEDVSTTYIYNVPNLDDSTLELADMYVDDINNQMLLTYTARISNTGSTNAEAEVGFTEPGGRFSYVAGSASALTGTIMPQAGGFIWNGDIDENDNVPLQFAVRINLLEHAGYVTPSQEITAPIQLSMSADIPGSSFEFTPLSLETRLVDTSYRTAYCAPPVDNFIETALPFEMYQGVFQSYQANRLTGKSYYEEIYVSLGAGGVCDGMVALSAQNYAQPGVNQTCTLWQDYDRDDVLEMHGFQGGNQVQKQRAEHEVTPLAFFDLFKAHTQDMQEWPYNPWILGLEQNMNRCDRDEVAGHSVLPYRTVEVEEKRYIYIYDPNYGDDSALNRNANRYIEILPNNTWRYEMRSPAGEPPEVWSGNYFRYVDTEPTYNIGATPRLPFDQASGSLLINDRGAHRWGRGAHRWGEEGGGGEIGCTEAGDFVNTIENAIRFQSYTKSSGDDQSEIIHLPYNKYTGRLLGEEDGRNDFTIYSPAMALKYDGNTPSLEVETPYNKSVKITRLPGNTNTSRAIEQISSTGNYTITVMNDTVDATTGMSYTIAYTLVVAQMNLSETIVLSAEKVGGADQLKFARYSEDNVATPTSYDLHVAWMSDTGESDQISRYSLPIGPEDLHLITVYDINYMPATTVCIDENNDTTVEDCLAIRRNAFPPEDELIYTNDTLTYTVTAVNVGTSPQPNVLLTAILPDEVDYNGAWSNIGLIPSYDPVSDRVELSVPILQTGDNEAVTLFVTTTVQGSPPDSAELHAEARSEYVDTVYAYPLSHPIEGTQVELSLTESQAYVGHSLHYQLHIVNKMSDAQENGQIKMNWPAGATLVDIPAISCGHVITDTNPIIIEGCNLGSNGGAADFTFHFRVNPDTNYAIIANAQYTSNAYQNNHWLSSNSLVNHLEGVRVHKTLIAPASGAAHVGDEVIYKIVVANVGTIPRYDVFVQECLPAGLSFVSGEIIWNDTSSATIPFSSDNCFDISLGALEARGNIRDGAVIQLTGRALPNASGAIHNQVSVNGSGLPEIYSDQTSAPLTIEGISIDLQTNAPAVSNVGDIIKLTATITNADFVPHNFTFYDPLTERAPYAPGSLQIIPADLTVSTTTVSSGITVSGSIPADSQAQIEFELELAPSSSGRVITNQAGLVVGSNAPIYSLPIEFFVEGVEVALDAHPAGELEIGGAMTYTIKLTNKMIDTQTGLGQVTMDLPPQLRLNGEPEISCGTLQQRAPLIIDVCALQPGGNSITITYPLNVKLSASQTITATAWYDSVEQDPVSSGTRSSSLKGVAILKSLIAAHNQTGGSLNLPGPFSTGDYLTYQIDTRNVGQNIAQNVIVRDCLPTGLYFVTGNVNLDGQPPTQISSAGQLCNGLQLGDLQVGGGATITLSAQIQPNAPTNLLNTAAISGADGTLTSSDPVSAAIDGIAIDFQTDNDYVIVSKTIRYTATVTNRDDQPHPVSIEAQLSANAPYTCCLTIDPPAPHSSPVQGDTAITTTNTLLPGATMQLTFNAFALEKGEGQTATNQIFITWDDVYTTASLPIEFIIHRAYNIYLPLVMKGQ